MGIRQPVVPVSFKKALMLAATTATLRVSRFSVFPIKLMISTSNGIGQPCFHDGPANDEHAHEEHTGGIGEI